MVGEGFIVIVGAMWLFLAAYVATEADKENRSTGFWFVFTLIFGIFALLLWVGRSNNDVKKVRASPEQETVSHTPSTRERSKREVSIWRALCIIALLLAPILVGVGLTTTPETYTTTECLDDGYCYEKEQTTSDGTSMILFGMGSLALSVGFYFISRSSERKRIASQQS